MIVNSDEHDTDCSQNVILKVSANSISATNGRVSRKEWKMEKGNPVREGFKEGVKDVYHIVENLEAKSPHDIGK